MQNSTIPYNIRWYVHASRNSPPTFPPPLALTGLSEVVQRPVGLDQHGEEALGELEAGLVDEHAAAHVTVVVAL